MRDPDFHPSEAVIEWLNRMKPDEIEALEAVTRLVAAAGDGDMDAGISEVRFGLSLVRSIKGAGRVMRWLAILLGGIIAAIATLPDQWRLVLKTLGWR